MTFVPGLTVRILTREGARTGHKSVLDAIVEVVTSEKLAGITVTRALEGYSAHGGMHTANWADIADDLPLIIEIVDRAERIEPVLPEIAALVPDGALTVAQVRLFIPGSEQ